MGLGGYDNAITGMRVSQRGLIVSGHNIANISTPGFSKQQMIASDLNYQKLPGVGQVGGGVDIDELRQLRDNFLDINYRNENSSLGYWDVKNNNIQQIQTILDEPFGHGLQESMNEFWAGWQELSKDPENLVARSLLTQKANVMLNSFDHVSNQLNKLQTDTNKEIIEKVNRINDIADQISDLNMKIKSNEFQGDNANDFRDKRNLLLDELSKIVNIRFTETDDHFVNVSIGSIYLVQGSNTNKMIVKENVPGSSYVSPAWEITGGLVNIKSGELKAYLEARGEYAQGAIGSISDGSPDGVINIDESQTIPSIKEKLNELLNVMTNSINAIHQNGYGIDNNHTTGLDFFTIKDPTRPMEMGNIEINPALFDLTLIAASSSTAKGDGTNAQKIVELRQQKLLGTVTDPVNFDEFYRDTVSNVGINAQNSEKLFENQGNLVDSINNKRQNVSGVNLDEEMAEILKYQHAYQANVRVLNTIDSMMDRLINGLFR